MEAEVKNCPDCPESLRILSSSVPVTPLEHLDAGAEECLLSISGFLHCTFQEFARQAVEMGLVDQEGNGPYGRIKQAAVDLVIRIMNAWLGEIENADTPERSFCTPGQGLYYDNKSRKLYYNGVVIKELRRSNTNQELVLLAFHLQHWQHEITDPIPANIGVEGQQRRSQTVRALNEHLPPVTIRFRANGKGTGFCWEFAEGVPVGS